MAATYSVMPSFLAVCLTPSGLAFFETNRGRIRSTLFRLWLVPEATALQKSRYTTPSSFFRFLSALFYDCRANAVAKAGCSFVALAV
jgi:hypothetical protein